MGILPEFHRQGIGKELFALARQYALEKGFSLCRLRPYKWDVMIFMMIQINFIKVLVFKEFEVFPTLWDEWNPCQIYVMYLG